MIQSVGIQSAIVTFPGHTHLLIKVVCFRHDKILLLAIMELVVAGLMYCQTQRGLSHDILVIVSFTS